MTPEESDLLKRIATVQDTTAATLQKMEESNASMLSRLVNLDEEMQQTLNYGAS